MACPGKFRNTYFVLLYINRADIGYGIPAQVELFHILADAAGDEIGARAAAAAYTDVQDRRAGYDGHGEGMAFVLYRNS